MKNQLRPDEAGPGDAGKHEARPGGAAQTEVEDMRRGLGRSSGTAGTREAVSSRLAVSEDKDMLEDLIAAALNDAVRRVETTTQEKMSGIAGGMGLPPGFKLPF